MSSTEDPWRGVSRSSPPCDAAAGPCELDSRNSYSRGSGNNTSDAESKVTPKRESASSLTTDLPPDPDAGLSEEQRRQAVSGY